MNLFQCLSIDRLVITREMPKFLALILILNYILIITVAFVMGRRAKSKGHIIIIGGGGGGDGHKVEQKVVPIPIPFPMTCGQQPVVKPPIIVRYP